MQKKLKYKNEVLKIEIRLKSVLLTFFDENFTMKSLYSWVTQG